MFSIFRLASLFSIQMNVAMYQHMRIAVYQCLGI